ncbi:MAG TPA: AzlD domain-containing protein [Acidimicrobiia bacterium]|jgi:branched-subunit amino acid transport protein
MSDVALVIAAGAITFASRAAFLIKPRAAWGGRVGRFLDIFPLALFVAIATSEFTSAPGSPVAIAAAIGGGVAGAMLFRRSLWGVLGLGAVAFYLARSLV